MRSILAKSWSIRVCKVQNLVDVTGILALKILGFEQVRTEVTSVELRTGPEVWFGKFSEL